MHAVDYRFGVKCVPNMLICIFIKLLHFPPRSLYGKGACVSEAIRTAVW